MPTKEHDAGERERCVTGIDAIDHILNGGIPRGNTVLVSGSVGTGKTVFPVPTDPETRTVFPRGMPPFRMWSIASMPVTHRSRSPASCSFVGIDSATNLWLAI